MCLSAQVAITVVFSIPSYTAEKEEEEEEKKRARQATDYRSKYYQEEKF